MNLNELIKKYEDKIKEYGLKPMYNYQTGLQCEIYHEILSDLEQLKEKLDKKELEYHHQLKDEETNNILVKIDNAFVDGKRFAIKEIIGE
ncbi:MAG: hypothetical protein PHG03_00170 [Bacilli bacterium]|nr:hypothetical protein [Bacilli bacterium]